MSIGIVGAGNIGSAIAVRLGAKGIPATIANSRSPETLVDLVAGFGSPITAGTVEEAVSEDIVFVAVKWLDLQATLGRIKWDGQILIDTNNPIITMDVPFIDIQGRTTSAVVQEWAPGARVVKAFNLEADPGSEGGRRVLFYAGDDEPAKKSVATLIDLLGFFGIDLGDLEHGSRLFRAGIGGVF